MNIKYILFEIFLKVEEDNRYGVYFVEDNTNGKFKTMRIKLEALNRSIH